MLCNSKMGGPGSGRIAGSKKTTTTKTKSKTQTQTSKNQKPVKKVVNRGYKKKVGGISTVLFGQTQADLGAQKEKEQAEQADQIAQNTQADYWYDFFKIQIHNEGNNKDIKSKIESKIASLNSGVKVDSIEALELMVSIVYWNEFMNELLSTEEKDVLTWNSRSDVADRFNKKNFVHPQHTTTMHKNLNTRYTTYCKEKCKNKDQIKKQLDKAKTRLDSANVKIQQIIKLKELLPSETSVTTSVGGKKSTKIKKSTKPKKSPTKKPTK